MADAETAVTWPQAKHVVLEPRKKKKELGAFGLPKVAM